MTTFTVEGTGYFPLDMLRYDACWPASGDAVQAIDQPHRSSSLESHRRFLMERRRVTLSSVRAPTPERWSSFGWRVLDAKSP